MPDATPTPLPRAEAFKAGLRGCCPRCGKGCLFKGWVAFLPACPACGLDYEAFNVGDGPAAILTLVLGALIAAAAITVELAFSPPIWVHILIWPPVTLALILVSLRFCKGALLALEYRNAAREGKISPLP